jgi:hypothetical protein
MNRSGILLVLLCAATSLCVAQHQAEPVSAAFGIHRPRRSPRFARDAAKQILRTLSDVF